MSAPDTNVKKQARRHSPSLYGITLALAVAVIAVVIFSVWNDSLAPADEAAPATVVEDS
ncbi:hypothetical protein V8J82_02625 [Gymnodinialimonas sp. 2305UL16-5]|uniref:hypothetical protein n=1 Tax=Gymnodinialimonas mytili TaxID=3126503 RepID=UPI0030A5ABCB